MNNKKIGKMIRSIRISKGISIYELATFVNVSSVYITQIEKHNKMPSLEVMTMIAIALKDLNILNKYIDEKYPTINTVLDLIENINNAKSLPELECSWTKARLAMAKKR